MSTSAFMARDITMNNSLGFGPSHSENQIFRRFVHNYMASEGHCRFLIWFTSSVTVNSRFLAERVLNLAWLAR